MKTISFLGIDITKKELESLINKTLKIEPLFRLFEVKSLRTLSDNPVIPAKIVVFVGKEYVHGRYFQGMGMIQTPPNLLILAHEIGHAFGLKHTRYLECSYCDGRTPECGDKVNIMCYNASIPHNNPHLIPCFSEEDLNNLRKLGDSPK